MIQKTRILTALLCLCILGGCSLNENHSSVCTKYNCIQVELADSNEKRMQGLMFREQLSDKKGMLFVFPEEGLHGFWMKNTLIPLDLVWIDEKRNIIDIQTAQLCQQDPCPIFTPSGAARYVLEINANTSEKLGFQKGTIVEIK